MTNNHCKKVYFYQIKVVWKKKSNEIGISKTTIAKLVKIWKDHDSRKETKLYLMNTLDIPNYIWL